jgi:endo-1,3(4)-beta-glucanase
LAKFASIVLAASDILDDKPLAAAGLGQLKLAFARFAKNEQKYPLLYECECQFFDVFNWVLTMC